MSADRLDELLGQARIPEPDDDGFTETVMGSIRAPKASRRSRGRFVTRPAVLAAAAVLATGGALAAAVRTTTTLTTESHSTAQPATAKPASAIAAHEQAANSTRPGAPEIAVSRHTTATHAAPSSVPRTFHNGTYEWGFTSADTSFVVDKRTGLKVVVDTRGVSLAAGRTHDVLITVINTSSSPMGISSQNGCALSAAAWRGAPADPSLSPARRDPFKASAWRCSDGTDARSGGGERFLLGSGALRSETVSLKVSGGDWSIGAVCRCDVVTAVDAGGQMTLHDVDGIVNGQASAGAHTLLTPVVGVKSR